jgi:phosphopantetheinyl transferase
LRDVHRREAWLFGRYVAKQLVQQALDCDTLNLASIAITTRNEAGESVRPTIIVNDEVLPWSLSISHGERLIAAFLETDSETTVGIDVVQRQPLTAGFQTTWFTDGEQQWVNAADADAACIVWGAKEAVYKAFNDGERFAPRKIEILPDESGAPTARYGGRELTCEIESRVFADDIIVIVKHVRARQ